MRKNRFIAFMLILVIIVSLASISVFATDENTEEVVIKNYEEPVNSLEKVKPIELPKNFETPVDFVEQPIINKNVASIGNTEYSTLDEAIKSALNMADAEKVEITLLADCSTDGISIKDKNISIIGSGVETVTFTDKGINLNNSSLSFDNCSVILDGIKKDTIDQNMSIVISNGAKLNLNNGAVMNIKNVICGIYACGNTEVNVDNNSILNISNCSSNGFSRDNNELDKVNVSNNSTLNIKDSERAITGSFNIYVSNSALNVSNIKIDATVLQNQSAESKIIFENAAVKFDKIGGVCINAKNLNVNNSTVSIDEVGAYGIYANSNVIIENNSEVLISNAGYSGIDTTNLKLTSSSLEIKNTLGKESSSAAISIYKKGIFKIDNQSTVNVHDNYVNGVLLLANAEMNVADGANVIITDNYATQKYCATKKEIAQCGGGLEVKSGAVANLSDSTLIYNNHAAIAGDDIFVQDGASIILPSVKANVLDDCGHTITGWYYDGYRMTAEENENYVSAQSITSQSQDQKYLIDYSRWNVVTTMGNVCNDAEETYAYALENQSGENGGILAIKAAHGTVNDTPVVIYTVPAGNPVEEIPEEDVPQADAPEDTTEPAGEETIVEEETPLADASTAVTGDSTALWVVLLVASGTAIVVAEVTAKKRSEH